MVGSYAVGYIFENGEGVSLCWILPYLFLSSIDEKDIERVQDGKVIGMSKAVLERINYIQEIQKGVGKMDAWDKQLIELANV